MPIAAIGAIAGVIAGYGAGVAGWTIAGNAMLAAVAAGAVAGAVVGGIASAVTGGDIWEGVLYGAVGGAVGGAIGGAFYASSVADMTMAEYAFGSEGWVGASQGASQAPAAGGYDIPKYLQKPPAEEITAGLTAGDKLMMAQGGTGMLSGGFGGDDESALSAEDQMALKREELETAKEVARIQAEARSGGGGDATEVARIQQETAMMELDQRGKEFEKTIEQRKNEMLQPAREAKAARGRQRATLTGLKVKPKRITSEKPSALLEV